MSMTHDQTTLKLGPLPPTWAAGLPAASPSGLTLLARYLRIAWHRRLLRDLHRNAGWATEARTTPTLRAWMDGHSR